MPFKVCPKCKESVGVRTAICGKCGHAFIKKEEKDQPKETKKPRKGSRQRARGTAEEIFLGKWVYDRPSGMPAIHRPEPIPRDRQLTNDELRQRVSYDGLGFCVAFEVPPAKIKDTKLAEMWTEAQALLKKIRSKLYGD